MKSLKEVFAERLINLREDWRITQQQLADKLGITRQSLSLFEKGERTINIELLVKIAKYFGVTTDYLLGQTDAMTTETTKREVCDCTRLSEDAVGQLLLFASCSATQEIMETVIKGEESKAKLENREIDMHYILRVLDEINISSDPRDVSQFLYNENPVLTSIDFINFLLEDKAFANLMNEIIAYHSDKAKKGIEDFDSYFIWKAQKQLSDIIERFIKQANDENCEAEEKLKKAKVKPIVIKNQSIICDALKKDGDPNG